MSLLAIDIETFSDVDLTKCGVYAYSDSPNFQILLFAFAFDDEPTAVVDLACGEQLPDRVLAALEDGKIQKTAFNAAFERTCISRYLGRQLSPDSWQCTAVQSAMLALPLSLDGVGEVLNIKRKKLKEGADLLRYFSMPCKPTKANGGRTRNLPWDAPEKWERFKAYCIRDVDAEREIREKLRNYPIPESEMELYRLDQEINDRGILVDQRLTAQAVRCDLEFKARATAEARELTGLANPNSLAQVKGWLAERGIEVESLDKKAIKALLPQSCGEVREMLNLRLLLGKTSVKKYEAIQRSVCSDGRVHGLLQFYGANRTGRWAGRLVQVQNLPQNHIPDLALARSLVKRGEFERVEMLYDSTPGVLSELIRTAFIPKKGCRFDVVRLHKFGALDGKVDPDDSPSKLPSFKAMQELAVQDTEVKLQLAKERQKAAESEFSAQTEDEWQTELELDKQGRVKDTLTNIAAIVRNDPNLQNIVYNEFKGMVDVIGPLPWKQVRPGWNDADLANAKLYFERVYGVWSPTKFKDALLAVVSSERLYHPVKQYLDGLVWDGIERLDTLLIEYLGAEDTLYVRAVTRKTFCAAVARIYEPGVKFDSMLVLNGPQGMGKSTFYALLGREWFSDSLSIADMRDKTAAEKLQGYWILEIAEMNGIKKVDVETVKSFLSRSDDKFRQAYGTVVESHPRANIIVGSSNADRGFLRDVTGNRRFWPVNVTGLGAKHPWELSEVDQVWAEALERYRAGEELYLKGSVAEEAYQAQQDAMETDDREGLVEQYLERLLPENWAIMDLYQRRSFLGGGEFPGSAATGTVRRERVCCMEIWCECFGKERENIARSNSYEIEGILKKLGGWTVSTANRFGKTRFSLYGTQKTFVRAVAEKG